MTQSEHQLIVEMFKQQALLYAGLVEVMKSNDLLKEGDLEAADALVLTSHREFLEANVAADYLEFGRILGVPLDELHVT